MTKKEYMKALRKELVGYGDSICDEILSEFESHFAEAASAGIAEEDVIKGLGTIQEVSENIRGMYGDPSEVVDMTTGEIVPAETNEEVPASQNTSIEITIVKKEADGSQNGLVLQDVDTIAVEGSMDLKLMRGEGDGFWEFTPHTSFFIQTPFWNKFWGERQAGDIEVERTDRTLKLTLPSGSGNLRIEVPGYVRNIFVNGGSSDMDIMDINLDCFTASVGSGDVSVSNCHFERADITASDGDIETDGLFGAITLTSHAGDVEVSNHQGPRLDLSSMAGDIEASTTSPDVSIRTQAGDIDLSMHGPVSHVTADTNAGDIDFRSESKDYTANVKSSAGDLSNKSGLPSRSLGGAFVGGTWTIGEGAGIVSLSTMAGDVTIR